MTSLAMTLRETLRYRGAIGQWSWVLHRLTGLGVLLFFIIHIVDTSWSVFYPGLYEEAIASYQTPLFTIGEFLLVAAVVYHAYNGLRIVILDYKPQWWHHQQRAAWIVVALTIITLVPVFLLMFAHVAEFYEGGTSVMSLSDVLLAQVPFVAGIALALVAAVIYSGLVGLLKGGEDSDAVRVGRNRSGRRLERFWWSYMRISGVLIVPLVFGHLAMMHIVQGVFDLTLAGSPIVGVTATEGAGLMGNAINDTGTAVEFVGERWNFLVASVAVWRIYDFALLALAAIHGFNGLRYVLTDYTMDNPLLRRAGGYVALIGTVVLLVVGGGALVMTIEETAVQEAERARREHLAEIGTEGFFWEEEAVEDYVVPEDYEGDMPIWLELAEEAAAAGEDEGESGAEDGASEDDTGSEGES